MIDRPVEERAVVVVVPVEDERIDAVVGGGGDLLLHDFRIRFIGVSPERHVGLVVAGETRFGRLDQFPFGPALALVLLVARIAGVVVAEIVTGDGDPRPGLDREAAWRAWGTPFPEPPGPRCPDPVCLWRPGRR